MTRILCIGCSWILKYVIGETLLQDSDDYEQEFVIYDRTQTPEEFFIFPPISRFTGDERLVFSDKPDGKYDCVIVDTNIISDVEDLMKAHVESGGKGARVIVLSSWEVYGYQGRRQIPFDEYETQLLPTTQLGKTKLEIEKICAPIKNLCILRLSTIYGPYMPENHEVMEWCMKMLNNDEIVVDQPASRFYDLNYVTNVIPPIQKAMTADLKGEKIFNIGSAEEDFKPVTAQNPKIKPTPMIFEQNIVNLLVGLRHLLAATASIRVSDENISIYQGKGFHSQLKTERARKILDYAPRVRNITGLQQVSYWLQQTYGVMEGGAPDMEETYPTLSEEGMRKIGLDLESRKKFRDIERKKIKEVDEELLCKVCQHQPPQVKQFIPGLGDKSYDCGCHCHKRYLESDEALV